MSWWAKTPGIAEHLGLSIRTVRQLVKDEVLPVTRLPSGTIIGNLDLIDETLLERGDKVARKQRQIIDKCLEGLK